MNRTPDVENPVFIGETRPLNPVKMVMNCPCGEIKATEAHLLLAKPKNVSGKSGA
jgi:hypothetical protein